ncbi:hypothetical protein Tco_1457905 [Tanacetum coccineum]
MIRSTAPVTSSRNTKTAHTSNLASNKPMLSSTGVKQSTSASRSQPSGNTKKDKIQQTPSSTLKNKVEAHPRKVKSSLKNKTVLLHLIGTAHVQHSSLLARIMNLNVKNSKRKVWWKPTGKVFTNIGYIWRPIGRTFTIVGNVCPLTRITKTTEVPLWKPITLDNDTPNPTALVYSKKPRKSKTNVLVSNPKILQSASANQKEPSVPNVLLVISTPAAPSMDVQRSLSAPNLSSAYWVYYIEGLGHNLFSVGQFCDSNLEVTFRQHTCHIRNLEGIDLLTGSRGDNLYTLFLGDMMVSSLICLLSKASKQVWLWHRVLHLILRCSFILLEHGLVRVYDFVLDSREGLGISHETSCFRSPQPKIGSSGPALHEMTPATISSGPVPNPPPSTPFVPPSRTDWDILFQPLFDELFNPPPIDQDAPSPSNSQTTPETPPTVIPNDVEEEPRY